MSPGDEVTVVHGHGVPGELVGVDIGIVRKVRRDGKVLVELSLGGTMWFDTSLIDSGDTRSTHRSPMHRTGDPDTARLAAAATVEHLTDHQWVTLGALAEAGRAGLIDHDHEARTGLLQDSAGKRRKELERYGLCEPTDRRRTTPRGSYARVHQITARGLAVWAQRSQNSAA
ncbi:MAG: hypothetical protein HKN44_13380 [Ilumatobacter sp.]|nr:hypothetical protein [Ilumatobacter sp.]